MQGQSQSFCPLCGAKAVKGFHRDGRRDYFRCQTCYLVFVEKRHHISPAQEKAEYDKHENHDEAGYRQFLSRVARPLTERLPENAMGLDFGCGPGPVLAAMLQDCGYFVEIFDPFYFPLTSVLRRQYDFVTATEVLEHLRQPRETLDKVWQCVKPGGYLAVMTKLVDNAAAFASWHYKNDPTHIIFFSLQTFDWLGEQFQAQRVYQKQDVTIFRKV